MQKSLQILIILGIGLWVFLLMAKYDLLGDFSFSARNNVDDANNVARCAKYSKTIEDAGRAMEYGDRVRQFVNGCW